ncbi:23S rRNA pseudouridine2457 synthase [Lutibacter agarilyticus]|uniref:Pseudouridine synthase n=1 Tax=Lutibacter agarilyticus TaxID=1109740 RepID=A0A238XZI4_9FLAO|nr:pseudouridine synthase [Lutibacter agarilyticus]SNR63449.1 23S rRNA pseudouridine2457 synthase [Lutibacter agarilyticus]
METAKHQNFIIFKPFGYLSQFVNNQTKRTKKKLLGELGSFPENTMAIGRLDEPSEGLLLLTTDGKVSEFIRSSKVAKEYYAQVDGEITSEAIELLKKGVEISTETGKYITKNCTVKKLLETPQLPERAKKIRDERHGPTSWVSITLTEGKFRQVRKMTAVVGFPTLRLVRVRIGEITISKLIPGEVKEVPNLVKLTC